MFSRWVASTNTPKLPTPSEENTGFNYSVSVASTYNGDDYEVGDITKCSGSDWEIIPVSTVQINNTFTDWCSIYTPLTDADPSTIYYWNSQYLQ